ncbi:MAG: NAD-dependent epimerase/dehydratase family protein [Planctomycetia bacterium]
MKVLVTGSAGFIAGYVVERLLEQGRVVVGLDNFSKYGSLRKSYDDHPNYTLVQGDARDADLMRELIVGCDHFLPMAARIGGIAYFHKFAYDLMADNERMTAAAFDAAIAAHKAGTLRKITVLSSSMVYENTAVYPTPEGEQRRSPPPASTYGFQKLSCEYFAQGAWEQYQLPYTIIRPFNCVGIGEKRALSDVDVPSGNIQLALSHVVPDLVQKIVKGQDPLHILGDGNQVRHYTYGGDLADGIIRTLEHPAALGEDFNISTPVATTVRELAEVIWRKVHGPDRPLRFVHDPAFAYDVQHRSPDVSKAERLLGFKATTSLETMLDEVIPWIKQQVDAGQI